MEGILTDTVGRVRLIREAIRCKENRLRARHPWLAYQDLLGFGCFLGSLLAMSLVAWLYLRGTISWWLTIPLQALLLSILHELEHDLIHSLYFRGKAWARNAMFFVIWFAKLGLNPWYRRAIHLRHHRASGQKYDIEERLIGLGLPLGWLRFLVAVYPPASVALFDSIKRDSPDFNGNRLSFLSAPTYLPFIIITVLFAPCLLIQGGLADPSGPMLCWAPPCLWLWTSRLMVLWILPNTLRQACLIIMSTYCHYYEDIPDHNVFYQNQILRSLFLFPFQLFCFNFGATHIIHHYVVNQPFYLRQMVARAAYRELIRQGTRVNDFGVITRGNHWSREEEIAPPLKKAS